MKKFYSILTIIFLIISLSLIFTIMQLVNNGYEMASTLMISLRCIEATSEILLIMVISLLINKLMYDKYHYKKEYMLSSIAIIIYSIMSLSRGVITCLNNPELTSNFLNIPVLLIIIISICYVFNNKFEISKKQKIVIVIFLIAMGLLALYGEYDLWIKAF